jgi:hypothetical protein
MISNGKFHSRIDSSAKRHNSNIDGSRTTKALGSPHRDTDKNSRQLNRSLSDKCNRGNTMKSKAFSSKEAGSRSNSSREATIIRSSSHIADRKPGLNARMQRNEALNNMDQEGTLINKR